MTANQNQNEPNPDALAFAQGEVTRETVRAKIFGYKFSMWMRGILSGVFLCVFCGLLVFIVCVRFDDNLFRSVGSIFLTPCGIILGYWFGLWTQR